MLLRRVVPVVVLALLVVAVNTLSAPVSGAEVAPGQVVEVVLSESGDGSGLALSTAVPGGAGVVRVMPDSAAAFGWDLGALEPAEYRSDLVRVEIIGFDGPGRLTIHTLAAHGRHALVVDRATSTGRGAPPVMVLQTGRRNLQFWSVDRPGRHAVELRASIPRAAGGTATTTATFVLGGEGGGAPVPTAPPVGTAPVGERWEESSARSPRPDERVVIADGHVDIGPRIVDGDWRVQLKDDTLTPHVWRDLATVVLHVGDAARAAVPDRDSHAFLGPPGTPYHVLPQAQQPGLVWPGWNSQDASVVSAVPGAVSWVLRGVDGPGRFVLFVTDSFGDTEVYFDSDAALPQVLSIPRNSHAHGSWAFGAPGLYRLEVEMSAFLADGTAVSDVRTLAVTVGDGTGPGAVARDGDGSGPPGPLGEDPGPGVSISTNLGGGPESEVQGTTSERSGRDGDLARTGSDARRLATLAAVLIIGGGLLHLSTLRASTRNRSHS